MGTFVERLEILINANSAGAVKGLGQTTEAALGTEAATSKLGKAMPIVGVAALAVGAAVYSSVKAYDEAHRSVLQLENSIRNNTLLAGASKDKFLDLADAIQQKTAADGDQVVSAEAILGTFRLTQDQILALTPLVVDYARKFDTDLVSAAKQVGKAMDGQVGALKRNGVSIDEVRFKTDRYGAVQQALRQQVGGFAEAEGKTFSGRLETLKNNVGDLQEAIGGELAPALADLAGGVSGAIKGFNDLASGITDVGEVIGTYFGGVLLGPIYLVTKAIDVFGSTIGNLVGSYDVSAKSAGEYRDYLEAMGLSQDEINSKLSDYKAKQDEAKNGTNGAAGALERQTNALKAATEATFAKLNADLAAQGSLLSVESAQESYNKSLAENGPAALETRQALNQYEQSIVSASTAAGKAAAEALGPNATGQEKARANTQAQIDTLTYLASTASPAAAAAIQAYITTLKTTPTYWYTTIANNADEANAKLQPYRDAINALPTEVRTSVYAAFGGTVPHASGGVFTSPHVGLVAEAGPEAIIPLNKPNRAAQVMAEAGLLGGQSSGGGRAYQINVNVAPGGDLKAAGAAAVDAIKAFERSSGTSWRS